MTVSLDKEHGHILPYDTETWLSTIMLPMYLSTVYPHEIAVSLNTGLASNVLDAFSALLFSRDHYDNATGRLV